MQSCVKVGGVGEAEREAEICAPAVLLAKDFLWGQEERRDCWEGKVRQVNQLGDRQLQPSDDHGNGFTVDASVLVR